MRYPAIILLCLLPSLSRAQAPPPKRPSIVGATSFKQYQPIILKAQDASKTAQLLWDVSGGAEFVECGMELHVWAAPGDYTVRLTAIDFTEKKVERTTFQFNVQGAVDPIPPGPGPKPPGPDPKPTPTKGLHVLILYETGEAQKLPAPQINVLSGATVRTWLNQNCSPWQSIKDWGIFDKDSDLSKYSPALQAMQARPRASVPWIVIAGDGPTPATPAVVYEGPLPTTPAETVALLTKYKPSTQRRKAG